MKTVITMTSGSIQLDLVPENEIEKLIIRELPDLQAARVGGSLVLTPMPSTQRLDYNEIPAFLRRQSKEEQ